MANLRKRDLHPDPLAQFRIWLDAARSNGSLLPEAMTLATVDAQGHPQARMVLFRGLTTAGFVFFTHYASQKARDLDGRPQGALVFHWPALERQVRVRGSVTKVPPDVSDRYFQSRPRGSQISAWVSPQSEVILERGVLEQAWAKLESAYNGQEIPRPPLWGGYELIPDDLEFWQGQPDRLHDRLRFQRGKDSQWEVIRLAP